MTNETQFFRKIHFHTLFEMVRKSYERVIVWEVSWRLNKTATYWPLALLAIKELLSRSPGLLNRGPWGPSLCWYLVLTPRTATTDSKLWSPTHWLPVAPDYIIFWHPPASVSVASAPNSTRQQSRLSPDIFDRMHLFFTQVHFLFDSLARSEVNMLYLTRSRYLSFFSFSFSFFQWSAGTAKSTILKVILFL